MCRVDEVAADFEVVPCPGCGSQRHALAHTGPPVPDAPNLRMQVVRCADCGLHYQNPRPKVSALGKFYPTDYSPYRGIEEDKPIDSSVRGLVLRDAFGAPVRRPSTLGRLVAKTVTSFRRAEWFGFGVAWRGRGRLLDFGCGGGKFLRRMHALGWDVTGVDFSDTAVNAVRASGLKAFQGTLPHEQLTPGSFDVVTMRHALEHVPDPRLILRSAWELLDRNGMLLIQVPNYASFDVARFGDASLGLDLPRHLTHFTPKTLEAMLRREGMENIRVRQISHANWIRKAAVRARGSDKSSKLLSLSPACRVAATISQLAGRGNEIIATAVKQ